MSTLQHYLTPLLCRDVIPMVLDYAKSFDNQLCGKFDDNDNPTAVWASNEHVVMCNNRYERYEEEGGELIYRGGSQEIKVYDAKTYQLIHSWVVDNPDGLDRDILITGCDNIICLALLGFQSHQDALQIYAFEGDDRTTVKEEKSFKPRKFELVTTILCPSIRQLRSFNNQFYVLYKDHIDVYSSAGNLTNSMIHHLHHASQHIIDFAIHNDNIIFAIRSWESYSEDKHSIIFVIGSSERGQTIKTDKHRTISCEERIYFMAVHGDEIIVGTSDQIILLEQSTDIMHPKQIWKHESIGGIAMSPDGHLYMISDYPRYIKILT